MMGKVDIETLTKKQYLMLTQGNQAPGSHGGTLEEMTIFEYMEYEAETKRQSWRNARPFFPTNHEELLPCFEPIQLHELLKEDDDYIVKDESEPSDQKLMNHTGGDRPFTPKPRPEDEELSFDKDLDDWLKTKLRRRMYGHDKEGEEDALIAILKSLVDEWEPNETMILGSPFLAIVHAQIDVFKREISLGIGEDRILFDMDGNVCHPNTPVENFYRTNSIQNEEPFNPLQIEEDLFSYESPSCLQFEQCTRFCDVESIDTVDSSNDMQGPKIKHKEGENLEKITLRRHMCKRVRVFYDNECGKDCGMCPTCNPDLSFCSRYDAIYGKDENGMLKQWMYFRDHKRQSIEGNLMTFADFLKIRYENKSIDDTTRERRYYEWVAQKT
ncbi:hypothetical protein Tco_0504680 [Tanacetum coccineum]